MASGSGKRPRGESPTSQVPEALKVIENVSKIVRSVWLNKCQCKRIEDRFKAIGEGLKQLDKDIVSGKSLDSSNVSDPALDELLTVLRKGEALVLSNSGMAAIYSVISRTDNREAFEGIHDDLNHMKARFTFEEVGVSGDILTSDAEKDLEEMQGLKALQKSVDGLSPIDECAQLSEKIGALNLEEVKKVVSEKSENREASDGLPSYLDIDMKSVETNVKPIREHVRKSAQDPVETFSWALVRSGRWLGCEFAVKVYKSGQSSWDRSQLTMEVGNLMELRHPNIIRFIGFAQGPDQCMILMELMDSDLKTFMQSRPRPDTYSEERDIITQIAKGMLYLHTQGYVHEDLKCSNVLVKTHGCSGSIEVKIGDLRNAKKLASIGDQYVTHRSRRPRWTALEVIEKYDGQKPSEELLRKSDVYSFAMTCYEVVSRKLPFQDIRGDELMAMIKAGKRPELPEDLNEDLRGLITSCWDSDPNKRPDFEEICHVLGIIRPSKSHAATDKSSSRKESKVVGPSGRLSWSILRGIPAFSGLFAGIRGKEQAHELPEPATPLEVDTSVNMDIDAPEAIKIPKYLRITPAAIQKVKLIGNGASADVWEVIWLGSRFAMKTFKSSTSISDLQTELDFLIQLRFPYIIQMVGLSVDSNQQCSIVMEFMRGSLRNLINSRMEQKRAVPFDAREEVGIIKKIALGMAFLHSRDVLHRDLKGANVLCNEHEGYIDVKIVDFGVSQHIQKNQDSTGSNNRGVGTHFWRAPEILPVEVNKSRNCDPKKADVYSFAMTCYEVFTGKSPFAGRLKSDYGPVMSGDRPELPVGLDSRLKALIVKCWHPEPEERPAFSQICDDLQTIEQALVSSIS